MQLLIFTHQVSRTRHISRTFVWINDDRHNFSGIQLYTCRKKHEKRFQNTAAGASNTKIIEFTHNLLLKEFEWSETIVGADKLHTQTQNKEEEESKNPLGTS